jgi:predicted nucleic acid-binding protein
MSGIRVCIDTNVFLNVLNKEETHYPHSKEVLLSVDKGILEAVIPALVISEVMTGFYLDKRNSDAEHFLSAIITDKRNVIAPLNLDIAVSSAKVKACTGLKLPDSIILATAIKTRAKFLVSNDNRFPESYEGVRIVKSRELIEILE